MKEYYTIGEFAKLIGKSIYTLRNWDNEGKFKAHHKSKGGHRYYSPKQVNEVLGISKKEIPKKTIAYCRVSSRKQKDDLERQVQYVKEYMIARGYSFEVITDIGSGINYNNKGLNQLIDLVTNSQVERIVVLYKDRLVRFGFELIENICNKYNTEIEIIDNTLKTNEQELVKELASNDKNSKS